MAGTQLNESAALAILDKLEARADLLSGVWRHGSLERDVADDFARRSLNTPLGAVPFLHCGDRGLLPIGAPCDDAAIETFALLLTHAHLLMALARIGIQHSGLFAPADAGSWHCRTCFSADVVIKPVKDGICRVCCQACGAAMDEIARPG